MDDDDDMSVSFSDDTTTNHHDCSKNGIKNIFHKIEFNELNMVEDNVK